VNRFSEKRDFILIEGITSTFSNCNSYIVGFFNLLHFENFLNNKKRMFSFPLYKEIFIQGKHNALCDF